MKRASSRPTAPPTVLAAFAKGARAAGFKVVIAGAGGAAHLPGMTAAFTALPVFGVPIEIKALSGQDSLLSIVQMPAGVPVGTLAIGQAGAINAALLAAAVLALSDPALAERLEAWRAAQTARRSPEFRQLTARRDDPSPPAPRSAFSAPASSAACWRWPRPGSACAAISLRPRPSAGLRRRGGAPIADYRRRGGARPLRRRGRGRHL